ncbi:MAG TPA: hypothetical protein ENH49_05300 [Candidatus Marinimicrobia bacterium]|nr:hypothetical protein [Candidatus Neomarinimicrobiota bacterium]
MKRINIKNGVFISVLLVLFLTVTICKILSEEITFWTILMRLPTAITIYGFALIIFSKWLWKYPIFKGWLVLIPNLSGEWTGKVKTTYQDPETGKKTSSKDMKATIKQDLYNISIIMSTKEMKSSSFVAAFDIDKNQNRNNLCYSYTSRPKPDYRDKSPMHDGTALLDIIGNPPSELNGEYWTTRRTTGLIEFKKPRK